ncbi:phosphoribosylglycinamide formyltransferase [Rurimicrobium arvi]
MSSPMPSVPIVIFASGRGSNAAAIIRYFKTNGKAHVALIVCNKATAGVLDIAAQNNIPYLLIDRESFETPAFLAALSSYQPAWIVLAGFLWKVPASVLAAFPGKVINIHPALLPKYGGKGMYGTYVHQAVINAAEKHSGITIHLANEHYDEGDVLLQASCFLSPGETSASLAAKIAGLEHYYLPRTLEYLIQSNNENTQAF